MFTCMFFRLCIAVLNMALFSIACSCQTAKQLKIEAVKVRDISQAMGETYYVSYRLGELSMYEYQFLFDSFQKKFIYDSVLQDFRVTDTLILREWRNQFLIFHKDSSNGHLYSFDGNLLDNRVNVKKKVEEIKGVNTFEGILKFKPDSTILSEQGRLLKEVYFSREKSTIHTNRFAFYFSEDFNHLSESLNAVLDSAKKKKFFRVEIGYYENIEDKTGINSALILDATEMKPFIIINEKPIKLLFEKYQKKAGNS